ncbi:MULTISPECIES: NACHT domain-containing protein [Bosea]|nr:MULTISPECIES: NACHT domain-containing protein [Bosea]MCT4475317.1 NACHT domain-containing protein [Bosea spartocytisi]
MLSTTEKGNEFRDTVLVLLEAAGFQCKSEIRADFKKADIVATRVDPFDGIQTTAIELKNLARNVSKADCQEFLIEYGRLVSQRTFSRAWLIAAKDISPDARALIEAVPNLRCFSMREFKRALLSFEPYLSDLADAYDRSSIEKYYISPQNVTGDDMETVIGDWAQSSSTTPIVIIGGYGQGKSTFAKHISAKLAKQILCGGNGRIPLLVPLGEIFDEQSVDGLVGKLLASQARVEGYHFKLFRELNRLGHFIIIFDGFDEMKHGMTPAIFTANFERLLSLNEGTAKLLFLGRDTVFHDAIEFRSVIEGKDLTRAGQFIPVPGKTQCRTETLKGFDVAEARDFVERYFPIAVHEARGKPEGSEFDAQWISNRLGFLLSGKFDELLSRPVHAQMLCQIATEPDLNLEKVSKFLLYDRFIHFLLHREVAKSGRFRGFSLDIRRRFNNMLAWWLWEQGGASTSSISVIPDALFQQAIGGTRHSFTVPALRRELIAGCLVIKDNSSVYFAHRSIQEFLVAEYLFENNLLKDEAPQSLRRTLRNLNPEIISFLIGWVQNSRSAKTTTADWFDLLKRTDARSIPLSGFDLFVQLKKLTASTFKVPSPWDVFIDYFLQAGATRFIVRKEALPWAKAELASKVLASEAGVASQLAESRQSVAASLLFWSLSARAAKSTADCNSLMEYMIACLFAREPVRTIWETVSESATKQLRLSAGESLPEGILFDCIARGAPKNGKITVDIERAALACTSAINVSFDLSDEFLKLNHAHASIDVNKVIKIVDQLTGKEASDVAKQFLNDPELRRRVISVSVRL